MQSTILSGALVALSAAATLFVGEPARANEEKVSSILYSCNLSFRATGRSIYLGVGYTDIHGKGTISCYDLLTGATQHLPIKVKARGPGAGLGITGLVLSGAATGVGVSAGLEELIGTYATVRGNAAAIVGASGGVSFRLSKGNVSLNVSVEAQTGLGAGVDLLWVKLEADGPATVEQAPVAAHPVVQASVAQTPVTYSRPAPIQVVSPPTKTIYVSEGQPLVIVDAQGKVIQTIYLKRR